MKSFRRYFLVVYTCILGCMTQSVSGETTVRQTLVDGGVVKVTICPDLPLTVRLPTDKYVVEGVGLTDKTEGATDEDLFISHMQGQSHFTLRMLKEFSAFRQLNIVCDGCIFGVRIYPTSDPSVAQTMLFIEVPESQRKDPKPEVQVQARPQLTQHIDPSADVLYGLLTKAKLLYSVRAMPERMAATLEKMEGVSVSDRTDDTQVNEFFRLTLHQVVRTDKYDALSFAVTIENISHDKLLCFDAMPFSVRVGDRVYHQAICDFDHVASNGYSPGLDPGASATAFFVVAGAGEAGRANWLAPGNQFQINVLIRNVRYATPILSQGLVRNETSEASLPSPLPTEVAVAQPSMSTAPVAPLPPASSDADAAASPIVIMPVVLQ